jgi:D-alanyl-D-alanine carboxypeptidase/D-alanyl-D-alanine-endopeptidase (penicillin-binding protein 4)
MGLPPGSLGARGRLAAGAAAAGLVLAAGVVSLAGPWDGGQRVAERDRAAVADAERDEMVTEGVAAAPAGAVPVLDPLPVAGGGVAAGSDAALGDALGPLLDDPALGGSAAASVVDLGTGTVLHGDRAGDGRAPASTVKIVTAVAALDALGGDHRLATTTVWDEAEQRVILVGGGDPTVTADDLAGLADRTAAALAERGVDAARIAYDDALYPTENHPIGVNTNIALITPLQLNEGRLDDSTHGPAQRSADPAADAARAFADALRAAGLDVRGGGAARERAPDGAAQLAVHRSAPLSALVERMLTHSDNDLAEALARHTALAGGGRADTAGVAAALTDRLRGLGLPLDGVRLADASGLNRDGRVTADLLTRALAVAADPARPELRAALTGLPVAGFTGTLADRYETAGGQAGAGLVRAKTGTLTGVNTLAGTATTPDGRLLAFAFLASDTTDPEAAEAALDTAAAALADLG